MKRLLFPLLALASCLTGFANAYSEPSDSLKVLDLETVTVYSLRSPLPIKKVPGKIELIPVRAIEKSGYTNLIDVLKTQSSVDVIQYNGVLSSVGIRGFKPSGKYVNMLVNGIPLGTDNITSIGVGDVEQVEILKGPFSSIYGTNAMGGVINLITAKSKEQLRGTFSLVGGSYHAAAGNFNIGGALIDKLSFDLSLAFDNKGQNYKTGKNNLLPLSKIEQLIIDPSTEGIKMEGSNYAINTGRLRLGYDFGKDVSLNVYQSFFNGADIPSGGSIWGVYGRKKKDLARSSTSFELLADLDNHYLKFSPYFNIEKAKNYNKGDETAFANYKSDSKSYGFMLQDDISLWGQHLLIGFDSQNRDTETERFSNPGEPTKPYQPGYATNNLGLFAQAKLSFLEDALNLTAGARADFMTFRLKKNELLNNEAKSENYNIINPSIGVKYEAVKGLFFHTSFGSAFTAPDAYQKSGKYDGPTGITIGNPDLKPEKSTTLDLGVGYSSYKYGVQLDLTYFHTNHRDMIISKSVKADGDMPAYKTFINSDKARMSGLEAIVAYDFGSLANYNFSLRAFMNATFMFDAKMKVSKDLSKWVDTYYVRKQNISFGLEYRANNGLELMLNGRFIGHRIEQNWFSYYPEVRPDLKAALEAEMPELAAEGLIRMPQTLLFDASVYYHVNSKLSLGFNLINIFDENYVEKDGYNMPGRNMQCRAIYKF